MTIIGVECRNCGSSHEFIDNRADEAIADMYKAIDERDGLAARLAEALQANTEVNAQCMKEAARADTAEARLAEAVRLLADIIDDAAFMACRCGSPTCRTTIVRNFLQQNVVAESSPRATESPESQGIVACKLHSATVIADVAT